MPSFAHIKLDFYDDPTMIRSLKNVPEFVRATPVRTKEELAKLGSENFALVIISPDGGIHTKFPVHTPGDTWLSMQAFEKNAHKLPVVMQETAALYLNKARKSWGFTGVTEMFEKVAEQNPNIRTNVVEAKDNLEYYSDTVKLATEKHVQSMKKLSGDWFGIITKDASGNTIKKYPLHTASLVKKASTWFSENYKTLRPELRKNFADNIISAASKHGIIVSSSEVFKYANFDYSPDMEVSIQVRRHYVVDETELHLLDDLLEKKASLAPKECAAVLEVIDKKLALDKYWDTHIPDPYTSVFSMAKFADYSYCADGVEVSGSELREFVKSKSFRDKLEAYISKDVIDELERNPIEVYDSLPKPEKRLIADLMKE